MESHIVRQQRKRRNWVRFVAVSLVSTFLLLTLAYTGGRLYIKRSLPVIEGEVIVKALEAPVTVIRDANGVPHVEASTLRDLYVSQGYVTAQDRLFQMDVERRQASGELSEVMGERMLERDKQFLTFGLRRAAEASYALYSKETKQILKWYADGVNAYIEEARKGNRWPIEFTLLGYEPKTWTPVDSLTLIKYMAFQPGGHWQGQLFRSQLLQEVSEEKALELFPSYPKDGTDVISIIKQEKLSIPQLYTEIIGINSLNSGRSWAVSGAKTVGGKPLLANAPQQSLATPSTLYEIHLQAPTMNVSGVTVAGIPGILSGHNELIAWGMTNMSADVQDVYMEKRNPENRYEFLYNGTWERAQVIHEAIRVKGKDAVDHEIIITRHGPILFDTTNAEMAVSLRSTAQDPSAELEAIIQMNRAQNWDSFKEALTHFHAPVQNVVFAAKDGTIAYRTNGKIPVRSKGDSLLPVPGWTNEYEWTGYIPSEELPTAINPPEGFVATAGNQIGSDSYPYHISHTWVQPYQISRIQEVLQQKNALTAEDMKKLQMDQLNLQAREWVPFFLQKLPTENLTEKEKLARALLEKWDFQDERGLGAPLVFHTWMEELGNVLFEQKISKELQGVFEDKKESIDRLLQQARNGQPGHWIQDEGGIEEVLKKSFTRAVKQIEQKQGRNVNKWMWGEQQRVAFLHPLSVVAPLQYLFNRETPIPVGGSYATVQAANTTAELITYGAAARFVIDLNDITTAYQIVAPGQSAHTESQWYHDQMKDWVIGDYHQTKLQKPTGYRLVLRPGESE